MTKKIFYSKYWPRIKDQPVTLLYGYVQPKREKVTITQATEHDEGRDVYLQTAEGHCYTIRPIKEIQE